MGLLVTSVDISFLSTTACTIPPITMESINNTHKKISWTNAFSGNVDLYKFFYSDVTGICHYKQFCAGVRSYVVDFVTEALFVAVEAHSCGTCILQTQSTKGTYLKL